MYNLEDCTRIFAVHNRLSKVKESRSLYENNCLHTARILLCTLNKYNQKQLGNKPRMSKSGGMRNTKSSTVLLETLTASQAANNFPPLMEQSSLSCSQLVSILSQINPVRTHPSYFLHTASSIILPSTLRPSKRSRSCRFPQQIRMFPSYATWHANSVTHYLVTRIFGEEYKMWSSSMCCFLSLQLVPPPPSSSSSS